MATKLAVKALTASDLTFFESLFRTSKAGNQKAINLNAEVFVREMYPAVPEYAAEHGDRLPIDLSIFGPGTAPRQNLQRKIIKGGTYKNWRLDGEFVFSPEDLPERYSAMKAGDIAVLGFIGDFARPEAISLILLSHSVGSDALIAERLADYLDGASMKRIAETDLAAILDEAKADIAHPLHSLLADPLLDDQLGPESAKRLGYKSPRRRQSRDELLERLKANDEYGRRGEELVNGYLRTTAEFSDIVWKVADEHDATAPYDFSAVQQEKPLHIDVKATGRFDNLLRFSSSELEEIRDCEADHYVFRVYDILPDGGAKLRIARLDRTWAEHILAAELPGGVALLNVAVAPDSLPFDAKVIDLKDVELPDDSG